VIEDQICQVCGATLMADEAAYGDACTQCSGDPREVVIVIPGEAKTERKRRGAGPMARSEPIIDVWRADAGGWTWLARVSRNNLYMGWQGRSATKTEARADARNAWQRMDEFAKAQGVQE